MPGPDAAQLKSWDVEILSSAVEYKDLPPEENHVAKVRVQIKVDTRARQLFTSRLYNMQTFWVDLGCYVGLWVLAQMVVMCWTGTLKPWGRLGPLDADKVLGVVHEQFIEKMEGQREVLRQKLLKKEAQKSGKSVADYMDHLRHEVLMERLKRDREA